MTEAAHYSPGMVISARRGPHNSGLRHFQFLLLPGEIRNRIYDILFGEYRVLIRGNHPQVELQEARKDGLNVEVERHKARYRLSCSFESALMSEDTQRCLHSLVPTELLRTCRTVHDEVLRLLYTRMTIRFESTKTLSKFLASAPPPGLRCIKYIEIIHSQYGEPEDYDKRRWKEQHDMKWLKICLDIASTMTSLESVSLDFKICDWPTQLCLKARWVTPLLVLKGAHGLDHVRVVLRGSGFDAARLQSFARTLEIEMMNPNGRSRRRIEYEMEETRRLEAFQVQKVGKCKAMKILRVKMPNTNDTLNKFPPIHPKYLKAYPSITLAPEVPW